jgi:hypothetical protein
VEIALFETHEWIVNTPELGPPSSIEFYLVRPEHTAQLYARGERAAQTGLAEITVGNVATESSDETTD